MAMILNIKASQHSHADIGDYLKVFACTAVMGQPILSLVIHGQPPHIQTNLGSVYNLIKYTAPAFIFGILYTNMRQHSILGYFDKRAYYRNIFQSLFIPTILWTLIYLVFMPGLQLGRPFDNPGQFCWQFINGNAAPHLWYNTMMLQFAILMPLFWLLHKWLGHTPWKGRLTLVITILIYFNWLAFYDTFVFHGPEQRNWYLLDRLFISFIIYAVGGVLAWNYRRQFNHWLLRYWPIVLVFFAIMFVQTNHELRNFGWPVNLYNATYYKPSMTIYSLMVIGLVATLSLNNQFHHFYTVQRWFHILADLAYRAYLSNVFWEQLIWRYSQLSKYNLVHPYQTVLVLWIGTWLLSFGGAYMIHRLALFVRR